MEERVKAQEEQKRLEVRAALEERLNIEMHCRLLEERRLAKEKLAAEQDRRKDQEAALDAERKCFEEGNRLNAAREFFVARIKQEKHSKCVLKMRSWNDSPWRSYSLWRRKPLKTSLSLRKKRPE